MNIQNELSLLFNSLFSDELLQTLLQIYQHDIILKQETVQMISQKIHDLTQQLNHEFHTIQREHLSSICVAWEERCYGVFRYAFYLGVCFASSLFSQTTTNIEEINRMEVYVAKVKQRFGIV